jgi:predicted CopG family antitoxin
LERSAYDLLRSRKLEDESFSEEIHRLLGPHAPALKDFPTVLSVEDEAEVADRVEAARAEELEPERPTSRRRARKPGRRP